MKKIFTLIAFIFTVFTALHSQTIASFINEVNYLASNPTGRGLEIAGEAGSNMDGWKAAVYNLNGTVNFVEDLGNQVIPSQQNGYGTIWYDVDQNSNGGGLALVNPNGDVEQFISYGAAGVITATEGAASGMASQYIGNQVKNNHSLQLIGTGLAYVDFLWALPGHTTRNGVNLNQVLGLLPPVIAGTNDEDVSPFNQLAGNQLLTEVEPSAFEINVYPNPVVNRVQVQLPEGTEKHNAVQLFDFQGRLLTSAVSNDEGAHSVELDMTDLPAGQYIIRTSGEAKIIVKR